MEARFMAGLDNSCLKGLKACKKQTKKRHESRQKLVLEESGFLSGFLRSERAEAREGFLDHVFGRAQQGELRVVPLGPEFAQIDREKV